MKVKGLPFRLGTTSYILPDAILPNVRFLADLVDDVELVLFEVDNGPNNLPDYKTICELNQIAQQYQLSYTVHLPLDLRLAGEDGERHVSLVKARKVIDCTLELNPLAYVLHLDGSEVKDQIDPVFLSKWNQQALLALKQVIQWLPCSEVLCVENLEHYPPELWDEVINKALVNRCVDIGHLWMNELDPVDFLKTRLNETRVMHIHGVCARDHQSLRYVPNEELERVLGFVVRSNFRGVMTLEIFNEDDLHTSMEALRNAIEKNNLEDKWDNN